LDEGAQVVFMVYRTSVQADALNCSLPDPEGGPCGPATEQSKLSMWRVASAIGDIAIAATSSLRMQRSDAVDGRKIASLLAVGGADWAYERPPEGHVRGLRFVIAERPCHGQRERRTNPEHGP
jgi:hypothetical protein